MTTLVLVRHGRTRLTGPVLAGWTPDLHLDDEGSAQASALGERLAGIPLSAVVSSPLDRCLDTIAPVLANHSELELAVDDRIGECHYGDWTGMALKDLAKDPMWKVVQSHPSAAVFPGGESLAAVQNRAVAAVRDWNARIAKQSGGDAIWLACSHGDVIKAIVADALGMHLDLFQRIVIGTCSATVIQYTELRPFVIKVNDTGDDLRSLIPPKRRRRRKSTSDAAVGGGR